MNERGQSWPEAMLSLVIIMVIFSSLLPMAMKLTTSLVAKKQAVIASQTTYQAAIYYRASGQTTGLRTHEKTVYEWNITNGEICVVYEELRGTMNKCVSL